MARNNIKQLLLIIACLLTSLSGFALDYESFIVDGIGYKILSLDDRTVAVTNRAQHLVPVAAAARGLGEEISQTTAGGYVYQYTDVTYSGKVVIPATVTYEGVSYDVTRIDESTFSNCKNLTSLTIPHSVTYILQDAFYKCSGLKELIIEDGEKDLDMGHTYYYVNTWTTPFFYCPLTSIYLGRNLSEENEHNNFKGWHAGGISSEFRNTLKTVEIGDKVTSIKGSGFAYTSALQSVIGGVKLETIGSQAFYQSGLRNIEIHNSLKTIEKYAFDNCSSLESISLPEGLVTIGDAAFRGCTSLTSLYIPSSVRQISSDVFRNCRNVKEIVVADASNNLDFVCSAWTSSSNENCVCFRDCPVDSLYLGRNIISNDVALYHSAPVFNTIRVVRIGNSVEALDGEKSDGMFRNCTTLSKIYTPWENPITITKNVFPTSVYTNATLLVPGGTVKKYQATAAWNEFANIVPTAIGVTMTATVGGSISLGDVTVTDNTRLIQVEPNSVLTFEITPEDTHFLTSVTVNDEDMTAQVVNGQLTPSDLSEDLEIVATFTAKPFYTVSATASTGGTATVESASVMWGNGTMVTLTANEGYELMSVTVNGTDKTSEVVDGVLTLSDIQENKTVVATFQKLRFAVTAADCENGSISLSATEVEWDASATATFTPDAHYEVATVSVNGEDRTAQLNNNQLTIANIRQATTIGATFRLQTFTITETHNEGGTVLLSAETAPWGGSVTVTITPDNEHFLEHVAVNGVDVTNGVANGEHTITVGDNTTVAVTFAAKPYYSVTVTASAGGTAIAGCTSVMWGCGTTVTLTPDECYELVSVTVNGVDKTNEVEDGVLTLEDIQEDIAVDAAFGVRTATITISSAGEGTYCGDHDLDFSGVQGLKAYIASGFIQKSGTVILTHVTDVPAGTGLMVKGPQGTYEVPFAESTAYYSNMFKGNVEPVYVDPTESSYTNFYLSNGSNGLGFYRITNTRRMSANRAILQLPTSIVGEARVLDIFFEDEDTSGIGNLTISRPDDALYDLQGRKVEEPAKGLYIKNGKKIIIK